MPRKGGRKRRLLSESESQETMGKKDSEEFTQRASHNDAEERKIFGDFMDRARMLGIIKLGTVENDVKKKKTLLRDESMIRIWKEREAVKQRFTKEIEESKQENQDSFPYFESFQTLDMDTSDPSEVCVDLTSSHHAYHSPSETLRRRMARVRKSIAAQVAAVNALPAAKKGAQSVTSPTASALVEATLAESAATGAATKGSSTKAMRKKVPPKYSSTDTDEDSRAPGVWKKLATKAANVGRAVKSKVKSVLSTTKSKLSRRRSRSSH